MIHACARKSLRTVSEQRNFVSVPLLRLMPCPLPGRASLFLEISQCPLESHRLQTLTYLWSHFKATHQPFTLWLWSRSLSEYGPLPEMFYASRRCTSLLIGALCGLVVVDTLLLLSSSLLCVCFCFLVDVLFLVSCRGGTLKTVCVLKPVAPRNGCVLPGLVVSTARELPSSPRSHFSLSFSWRADEFDRVRPDPALQTCVLCVLSHTLLYAFGIVLL